MIKSIYNLYFVFQGRIESENFLKISISDCLIFNKILNKPFFLFYIVVLAKVLYFAPELRPLHSIIKTFFGWRDSEFKIKKLIFIINN